MIPEMRILWYPQPSMRSYSAEKWLLQSDSQITKFLAWAKHLPSDWQWTLLVPDKLDLDWAVQGIPKNVTPVTLPWAPNVQTDRYHFPMPEVMRILADGKYDVIVCEAIEKVLAVNQALKFLNDDETQIVGMIGLFDNRSPVFYARQLEGFMAADLVVFPLPWIRDAWMHNLEVVFGMDVTNLKHVKTWPALFSPKEVLKANEVHEINEMPVIHYISRLSNDLYGTRLFFEAVRQLEKAYDFEVWCANPNAAMDDADVRSLADSVKVVGPYKNRAEYLRRLWQSDIVPFMYPQDRTYSVGFCEAITAKNLIVETGRSGISACQVPASVAGVLEGMITLLNIDDDARIALTNAQYAELYQRRSVEQWAGTIEEEINKLVKGE